ncbi:hypothetical protein XM38_016750 [Halomicronema hongdechloris C2206]|uniref:Uncharacterized protein n=1 Tax=Halomicronema hongdechloris C2206 TaxID=1641165 RepID=A0A1Z3HK97_9CYAN|nr:hypothetical protein [Halomicronema hongdechloris]ASC70730.1 hypothetical protein XM38_016750 [Halomicronema hongdechloris C2206]
MSSAERQAPSSEASDQAYDGLLDKEKQLNALSERMLLAVAVQYGKDSYEYEMAGGTRTSERKRLG